MSTQYKPNDKYFQKAKKLGYRARSVFKLEEIQEKFRVIKYNDLVLDLGACPGSWSQYVSDLVGEKGRVIAVDLQPMEFFEEDNIEIFEQDVFNLDNKFYEQILEMNGKKKFDVIVADLAPNTTGVKDIDIQNSLDLNYKVLEVVKKHLKKGGYLVSKVFQGDGTSLLFRDFKRYFGRVNIHKPKACRQRSYETFIVAKNK